MVFSEPNFLFLFLPTVLIAYVLVPKKHRNWVLLTSSLLFYIIGAGALVILLLISVGVDYSAGRIAALGRSLSNRRLVRIGVAVSVVANISLLSYFKYANFLVDQLNALALQVDIGTIAWTSVVLPIGISFYTFQSMSYTIDVARGDAPVMHNVRDFALYVSLFPQLVAGPIVRFHEIADEVRERRLSLHGFSSGSVRFVLGLLKKVAIADSVAVIADAAFALPADRLTLTAAWLGTFAYSMQIYFDFSGYSDMAIGLGRMFGFRFPENFRRPYSAASITDFWRRWHITLSAWFKDYLYIPMGGSRGSSRRTYRNLAVVFLLTGLWHGAAWTFIVWGAYHGSLLIIERVASQRATDDRPKYLPVRRAYTFVTVMIGWVLFRSDSLSRAWTTLTAMFSDSGWELPPEVGLVVTTRGLIAMIVGGLTLLLPRDVVFGIRLSEGSGKLVSVARVALVLVGLPYALSLASSSAFSPFLYYQF